MPKTIPYREAPIDMRRAWDRLIRSHAELGTVNRRSLSAEARDAILSENVAAIDAYRKAARKAGYIGGNGRTAPPHLEKTLPLKPGMYAVPTEEELLHPALACIQEWPHHEPWRGPLVLMYERWRFPSVRHMPPGPGHFQEITFQEFIERLSPDPEN